MCLCASFVNIYLPSCFSAAAVASAMEEPSNAKTHVGPIPSPMETPTFFFGWQKTSFLFGKDKYQKGLPAQPQCLKLTAAPTILYFLRGPPSSVVLEFDRLRNRATI